MSNSLIPVAPGFDTPLEMLEACHERLQAQLVTLERLARWLPEHGADEQARRASLAVIRYFDVAAVNHHLDEEQDLIPALLEHADAADTELPSLVARILAEHQELFAAWSAMRERLAGIADGEHADLDHEAVEAFSQRYNAHIELEETRLLPLARRLLDADTLAALSTTMTARRRSPAAGKQLTPPV